MALDAAVDATPPPPSRHGAATPAVGSPKYCNVDDRTKIPLATSTFVSELAPAEAQAHLEGENELCGDTRCEGSFEWFLYDLRSDAHRSELTMRVYARFVSPKGATARTVVVRGDRFVGRVLREAILPSCTTACGGFAEPPLWKPCLVLDLRCEIERPWKQYNRDWQSDEIACGIALESAIRNVHPEFD